MTARVPTVLHFLVLLVFRQVHGVYKVSNVLAHYRLDGSDTTVSIKNARFTPIGRYPGSKAIHFNQRDSYVSTPQIVLGKKNFTIACWIKIAPVLITHRQTIYGDWFSPWQFYFYLIRDGLQFERHQSQSGDEWWRFNGTFVHANQWTHVAVTWKQNEKLSQLYVDAVEIANRSFGLAAEFYEPTGHAYRIGNDGHVHDHQFYGAIMDLYVLDVALSPDELNQLRGFPNINTLIPPAVTLYESEALKCKAEGLPSPHVTWLHNGQIVDNGTSLAILKIPKAGKKLQKGIYKCAASNMVGNTSKVVNITIIGPFALCTKYSTIDDVTRSVNHPFQGSAIAETVDNQKWYRLRGKTGTQLPTRCVPTNRCGAQTPGWLDGKYPDVKDGIVQRKVCFHFNGDCCGYENTVQIRKCSEGFYVYKFESLPSSIPGRYCAAVYRGNEEYISSPIFVSTLDTAGFALKGHVMYTVNHVPDPTLCMSYCNLMEKSCDSFNFSPQHQVCELNNVTKETHDAGYKQDEAFIYYEKAGQSVKAGEAWCGQ